MIFTALLVHSVMLQSAATVDEVQAEFRAPMADETSNPKNDTASDTTSDQDLFDIDAPFDETLDLGVDWPELDMSLPTQSPSDGPDFAETASKAGVADKTVKVIEGETAAVGIINSEINDLARQQALEFEDDVQITGQEEDSENFAIGLDTQGVHNYRVSILGLAAADTGKVFERFNTLSSLKIRSDQTANGSQILRRAKTDTQLMDQLLRLEGYYDNLVTFYSAPNERNSPEDIADLNVIIDVVAGAQYRYGEVVLPGLELSEDTEFLRAALDFAKGDVVNQDAIEQGRSALQNRLLNNGYPFARVGEPDLLIDHARQEGDLTLPVSPDRKYQFGRIITGAEAILSGRHLETIARFDSGDIFQQSEVNDLRQAIFATSLASNIVITPTISPENPDQVDLNVELAAAPPRTVAGQLGFNTGEGFRVETSWEHRNFFPPEGALNIAGILGTREQAVGITMRRNNFRGRDRVLTASFLAQNQNLDAFDARSLDIGITYERQTTLIFQKKWAYNVGIEYLLSDERAAFGDNVSRELFNIFSIPAGVSYDGSNDLLDPTKGFRLSARIAPEISTGVDEIAYLKSQIDGSIYQPVSDKLVVAGRVRFASIAGTQTSSIAPSRRNYAGGGGSVRGFGFQDIGPIDANGNPIGGRGLVEFAIEARYRIGSFGIVPFFDAGGVSSGALPNFDNLRFAAGVGLRYYTSFGPVRIDVGTPFNRRAGENVIAVAISLGQAF